AVEEPRRRAHPFAGGDLLWSSAEEAPEQVRNERPAGTGGLGAVHREDPGRCQSWPRFLTRQRVQPVVGAEAAAGVEAVDEAADPRRRVVGMVQPRAIDPLTLLL